MRSLSRLAILALTAALATTLGGCGGGAMTDETATVTPQFTPDQLPPPVVESRGTILREERRAEARTETRAEPVLSAEEVREVQQALQEQGYDVGPVDGVFGDRTRQALRDFQSDKAVDGQGAVNRETIAALGIDDRVPQVAEQFDDTGSGDLFFEGWVMTEEGLLVP